MEVNLRKLTRIEQAIVAGPVTEALQLQKPLVESILLRSVADGLFLGEDCDLAHDPGEDGDAHQHDEDGQDHLLRRYWEVIAIADRRENSKRVVHHDDQTIAIVIIAEAIDTQESVIVRVTLLLCFGVHDARGEKVDAGDAVDHQYHDDDEACHFVDAEIDLLKFNLIDAGVEPVPFGEYFFESRLIEELQQTRQPCQPEQLQQDAALEQELEGEASEKVD